jgi:putative FmdB family regulatory protein
MPTYEYRCPAGHEFERFYRKISDAAPGVTCPECGKVAERIMSVGGGFAFKGSGFYLTDYGKNAHRGTAPQADGAGATSGDSSSAKESSPGETAPASKESPSPAKETSGSKDSGAKASSSGDTKPAPASKPAESKSSSESKPKKSGGSKSSKDK